MIFDRVDIELISCIVTPHLVAATDTRTRCSWLSTYPNQSPVRKVVHSIEPVENCSELFKQKQVFQQFYITLYSDGI